MAVREGDNSMMGSVTRVMLADNHALIRSGIRTTLSTEQDITLVGEAVDGEQAQQLCVELMPDVLLLDLQMPGHRPIETVNFIRQRCPDTKVIILTAFDDDAYVRGLVAAGVAGYVLKDDALETLAQAIRIVMQGGNWFSRPVLRILAEGRAATSNGTEEPGLSSRDHQLLRMLARGWDNHHIASEMNLADQTVRNYISELYQKLGLKTRGEAIIWARERGLN